MDYEKILYQKDPPVGRIVLNEPEKRNPLGYKRLTELAEALKEMERDDDIHIIIIKGAGPCFSAGYDLRQPHMKPGSPNLPPSGVYINAERDGLWGCYLDYHVDVYMTIWKLQKPVIAQIHSYCLAGATELAAFCDIRMVADNAQIGWPVGRNLSPGNIQIMPWIVGITKAKEYMFTGDPMDAQEAYRAGWATRVVPLDKLEEETERLAKRISGTPIDLLMFTKRSVNRQYELMGFLAGINWSTDINCLQRHRKSYPEFGQNIDREGVTAALDKRDGKFGDLRTSKEAKEKRKEKKQT